MSRSRALDSSSMTRQATDTATAAHVGFGLARILAGDKGQVTLRDLAVLPLTSTMPLAHGTACDMPCHRDPDHPPGPKIGQWRLLHGPGHRFREDAPSMLEFVPKRARKMRLIPDAAVSDTM